jgi:hypothetical protein
MDFLKSTVIVVWLVLLAFQAKAQITVTGMVADSVTLTSLPDTNIRLKKSGKIIHTDSKGFFNITIDSYDTLIFSRTGYELFEYPVFFSELDILILISEDVRLLQEVTVIGYPESANKHPGTPRVIHTLPADEMFHSPFTYFSRIEKDKRKLLRYRNQQARIQVYADVVADPQLKQDIMSQYSIDQEQYHRILVQFNTTNKQVQYITNEHEIVDLITAYFEEFLKKEEQKEND